MYIYMIGAYSPKKMFYIKVGVSNNVERRIKDLQTGHPLKLKLIKCWKARSRLHAFDCEKSIHWRFRKDRLEGEWYREWMKGRLQGYINKLDGVISVDTKAKKFNDESLLSDDEFLDIQYIRSIEMIQEKP